MSRCVHMVVNPKGGVGDNRQLAEVARQQLEASGITVAIHLTERAGHACELAKSLEWAPGDCLCGVGGDGTMHELVNGMMARPKALRAPLALLPGGTGNSLLRDLEGLEVANMVDRVIKGETSPMDLFTLNVGGRHHFGFNIVGWGMVSSANQLAESMRLLGRRRYDVASVVELLRRRRFEARLQLGEDEVVEGAFTLVACCNTVHTGEGMRLAPRAKLCDGLLDVLYVREASRSALLRLFTRLSRGEHVDDPLVHYRQVPKVSLSTAVDLPLNLDGELIESGSFAMEILPGELHVVM